MKKSNTNFNLYKTFVTVYQTKNLSHAAKILGISNVATGQNIKELSNQLRVILFNSHRKGVEPTSEAHNLYPKIKNAIEIINEAERELGTKDNEIIKMAISSTAIEFFIKLFVKEFYIKHPKINLEIYKCEALNTHQQKELDFVIDVGCFIKDIGFKYSKKILDLRSAFVASKKFLESKNLVSKISKEEFIKLPLISRYVFLEDIKKELKINKKFVVIKTPSADVTHTMIKDCLGAGFLCKELVAKLNDNDLVVLDIEGVEFPVYEVFCGYNRPLSKFAQTFIDGFFSFVRN